MPCSKIKYPSKKHAEKGIMSLTKEQKKGFTKRELEVYNLRMRNFSITQIAKKLGLSRVRIYQVETNIIRKLKNPPVCSVRLCNALREAGIKSIKEAQGKSDYELLSLKNFGKNCLLELRNLKELS